MLFVDPHVIGSNHKHVVHRSRLDKADGRFQPQRSANRVDVLSIAHGIDVLTAKQTATTNHRVGSINKVTTHKQNAITCQQDDSACEQGNITCKLDDSACEEKHTESFFSSLSVTKYLTFFKIRFCFVSIINCHFGLHIVFCSSIALSCRPFLLRKLCLACRKLSDNGFGLMLFLSHK